MEFDTAASDAVRRTAGSAPGDDVARSGSGPRRPGARSSTSGRTSSAGCASRVQGRRGLDDHGAARRGARARRARRPPAAHRARRPTGSSSAAATTSSSRRSPSTASATPRSTAGRASSPPTRSRRSSCTPTCERIGHFACSDDAAQPAARATSCGACAATSSTCRPTARSATSGSAGPATSPCSRRPRRSSTTSQASSQDWLRRPRRSSSTAQDGLVPFVVPDVLKYVDTRGQRVRRRPRPRRSGATPRCGCRGRCGRRTATGRCSTASYDSMSAHVRRVASLLSPTGLWDTGFQFGDWLDPARAARPAVGGEGRPRSRRDGVPATARAAHRRRPRRGSSAATTTQRAFERAGGPHRVGRSTSTTSRRRHDHERRRHRLRAGDRLRPARRLDRASRRRPAGRAGRRATATASRPGSPARPFVTDALTVTGHLDDAYRLLLRAELPVVALPGDDGRDDDLGALGLDAPRRHRSTRAR